MLAIVVIICRELLRWEVGRFVLIKVLTGCLDHPVIASQAPGDNGERLGTTFLRLPPGWRPVEMHMSQDYSDFMYFITNINLCWYNPTGCASVVPIRLSLAGEWLSTPWFPLLPSNNNQPPTNATSISRRSAVPRVTGEPTLISRRTDQRKIQPSLTKHSVAYGKALAFYVEGGSSQVDS